MDLFAIMGMTPDALRARTESTVRAVHAKMDELAPNNDFRECITSEVESETRGRVMLGFPAVFVDRGAKPRNMSEPLLRSPKAKISKTGARYMSIKIGDEWRTTSDNRPPWMSKGKPGAGVIKRVLASLPELMASARSEARGGA